MLLRGCHKRMICIKSADSRLFDEAFFVLREDGAAAGERDMLTEANRILEDHLLPARRARRGDRHADRRRSVVAFLCGALSSALVCFLATLLLFHG